MRTRTFITASLLGLWACNPAELPGTAPPPTPYVEPTVPDHWTPTTPSDRGPASLDPVGAEGEGKVARRMTIDQLRASIPALFDGITWTIGTGRNAQVGFDALSSTLGEADYLQATHENTEATPLFAKFMDDMAGDVCDKAVARDQSKPIGDRVLILDENDVAGSLRYLRLKLHGIYVPAGSNEGIESYLNLHTSLLASDGAAAAWTGVCITMLTAPELLTY